MDTNTTTAVPDTVAVGDHVEVNDPWLLISGTGIVAAVDPWTFGSTAITVDLKVGSRIRTYPYYVRVLREVETAVWCCWRGGYADNSVGCDTATDHVHYEVQYDGPTGRVLTSPAEQAKRRSAAEAAA